MSGIKTAILVAIMIYSQIHVDGQEVKAKSKCDLISILMNSEKKWLTLPRNPIDSTVNVLDPEHLLDSCRFMNWRGFKINIISSGILIDSIKHFQLHFVTKDKPTYYAIREYKSKGYWQLVFHHGFDNVFVQAPLRKKHSYYYMGKIAAGIE